MATWQAAQPGTVIGDGKGNYQIRIGGQWTPMPKGSLSMDSAGAYHFDSDLVTPPAAPAAGVPGSIESANKAVPAPSQPNATDTANNAAAQTEHGPVQSLINAFGAVPHGLAKIAGNAFPNPTEYVSRLQNTPSPSGVLESVRNSTEEQIGENVLAPAILGHAMTAGVGAAGRLTAPAPELTPAAQLGLRTAQDSPTGTALAGKTTGPTLTAQNQNAAASVLGADAGVPHSSPVTAETLAQAREAPGRAMDVGYDSIQPGPLSPAARAQVLAARGPATITKPTPNVANAINDIESSLLDPNGHFSGAELRATRNSLNSDAQAAVGTTDADQRAIANYKRNVVQALDQHVVDSLPAGSAISPETIGLARQTLAKNYQLQDLIGKGGDIDLQGLAKLHRENPNLLTGPTRTVAQFASDHPEVTGGISDANRIAPPSLMTDVAHINVINPRSWVQPLVGAAGRRMLTGAPGEAVGAAMQTPVVGLGGEFEPRPVAPPPPPEPPPFAGEVRQPGMMQNVEPPIAAPGLGGELLPARAMPAVHAPEVAPLGDTQATRPAGMPGAELPGVTLGSELAPSLVGPRAMPTVELPKRPLAPAPEGGPSPAKPTEPDADIAFRKGEAAAAPVADDPHNVAVADNVIAKLNGFHAALSNSPPNMGITQGLHKLVSMFADGLSDKTEEGAFFKSIYSRLKDANLTAKIVLPGAGPHTASKTALGSYSDVSDTAAFPNLDRDPLVTVAHEAVHAATLKSIRENPALGDRLRDFMEEAQKSPAVDRLSTLDQYGAYATGKGENSLLLEPGEVVSESQTNPRFQQALRDTPSMKLPGKSLYDEYKEIVGTALKLPPTAMNSPLLDRVLAAA